MCTIPLEGAHGLHFLNEQFDCLQWTSGFSLVVLKLNATWKGQILNGSDIINRDRSY